MIDQMKNTECDLTSGEQITLGEELLIPISALDKIRTVVSQDSFMNTHGSKFVSRVNQIIDKHSPGMGKRERG